MFANVLETTEEAWQMKNESKKLKGTESRGTLGSEPANKTK